MVAAEGFCRAQAHGPTGEAAPDLPTTRQVVVVVSNASRFGGGGVVGFREILLAVREQRPDLEVVGVLPQRGKVADACASNGIATKIAWVPWWTFGRWGRTTHLDPHAVLGWLPYTLILLPGIVQAVVYFRRIRPALVITNTMTIPSHAIAAKLLGIPHYWVVREFGRDDHGFWFLFGYRRTIRLIGTLSEVVICNSQAVESSMLTLDPTMKTAVVYPGVDTPVRTPPHRAPGERLRAILVGYLSKTKGQCLAIEAIARARAAGVDIELTLVGGGRHRCMRRLARRRGVADLLTIHRPTSDLGPHWARAHVGLMCSQREAFGRVTIEAMRAGLPVCGVDSGGTPELIEPGLNGFLSPAGDADALAANLIRLEADEDLRRRLGAGAVQSSQRFRRERHDGELVSILGLR
ncbi:hypothetical protein MANY_23290 [Mycolicibacterium anyangense]|uniref:Glycosyl transferase family 1 domain-containing protein n=1 Tax=Mycolicibacterium anyangense TaxID=1431246 RepID=A0A6N4WAB1_9MYCO|nr:glycosyltransferase family 4 protein [Mycolicibacterium anyangense]BBZ76992.1 hypothetical protein MANY_23290 [Mycolicibacterium anyangense]